MYSYVTLSQRIPGDHPARRIRALAAAADALQRIFKKLHRRDGG